MSFALRAFKKLVARFISFSIVGALATALHYLILVLLVRHLGLEPVGASSAGYVISAVFNYSLNYRFTFRSTRRHIHSFPRFCAVAAVGLPLNAAVLGVGVRLLDLHYLIAQIIATVVVLAWNFFANLLWSFRDGQNPDSGAQAWRR